MAGEQESPFDQTDENFCDAPDGSNNCLPPLQRIQKFAQSINVFDRQMVSRVAHDLFRTSPVDVLTQDISGIMNILIKLVDEDETMVRTDILEQVPHLAAQAIESAGRVPALKTITGDYLLPLVVKHLGSSDTAVDKAAHCALIHLLEQGLITSVQAEIQVCPTILALSKLEGTADVHTNAISLMCTMAPLLGRDVTERIFLRTFTQLCSSQMFYVRKACTSHFGDFCAVVGKEAYETVLLPCYIELCQDTVWGVRKSCAEVIMFVSCACTSSVRHTTLAPTFAKLLQDECRWVRMSAFQTLGPFISTFASPKVTNMNYNNTRELVLFDEKGNEYSTTSRFSRNVREVGSGLISEKNVAIFNPFNNSLDISKTDKDDIDVMNCFFDFENYFINEDNEDSISDNMSNLHLNQSILNEELEHQDEINGTKTEDTSDLAEETEEDIKEIVESVKNAVLSYRNVDQTKTETGTINEKDMNNANVIIDHSNGVDNMATVISINNVETNCDNLDNLTNANSQKDTNQEELGKQILLKESPTYTSVSHLNLKCDNCNELVGDTVIVNNNNNGDVNQQQPSKVVNGDSKVTVGEGETNQVNNTNNHSEDDNLHLYNSYNYWYISPELPLDPCVIDGGVSSSSPTNNTVADSDMGVLLDNLYLILNGNGSGEPQINPQEILNLEKAESKLVPPKTPPQDVVPQTLIDHFISMTDPYLASNIDSDMAFYCAYSLPAVVLTLGSDNWNLLKNTVNSLAGDMQYKVRRTIASCLHELALILGPEGTTVYLTPLFDEFMKDLDEVRIGILKHLANFLKLIKPVQRTTYLPRLQQFLTTDNVSNWRFRQELAIQLLQAVNLFKPADAARHISQIAEQLLCDPVAAVREDALILISKLVKYTSTEPALVSLLLVQIAEKFAHSKKWRCRQTFALLCIELLSSNSLSEDQFATQLMPHLLDLSWDPVANVRLVVARSISNELLTNEYFLDSNNCHIEILDNVINRLQADKDRDVRQCAEQTILQD